jgi:autotransporter-associated beta strand protein
MAASLGAVQNALATSETWTGAGSDLLWTDTNNWSNDIVPGLSGTNQNASPDTATFNISSGAAVTVDTKRNIDNIYFDTNVGSFSFNTGVLYPTNGGTIQLLPTVTSSGQIETFNDQITIQTSGSATFANNAPTSDVFDFNGIIKPSATTGPPTLVLAGSNTGNNIISGPITVNSTSLNILKTGAGTWNLTGTNTGVGTITDNQGVLGINFSESPLTANIVNTTAPLTLGGGTLNISGSNGETNSQSLGAVTIAQGASEFEFTQNGATSLTGTVASINRANSAGSTVDFTLPTSGYLYTAAATTSSSGILVASSGLTPYATVSGADWAALSSSNTIVGLSSVGGYTPVSGTTSGIFGNLDVTANVTGTATLEPVSIRFNASLTGTLSAPSGYYIYTSGILVTPNVGAHTTTINGAARLCANASGDLAIIQNNPYGGLTIAETIISTGSKYTSLTKSGPGLLTISNTSNDYNGFTYLNGGTVNIAADGSIGDAGETAPIATSSLSSNLVTLSTATPMLQVGDGLLGQTITAISSGTNITLSGNANLSVGSSTNVSYIQPIVMNGGTLQTATNITLSESIGAVAYRPITLNAGGGAFDTQGFNDTVPGVISGVGSFTKVGSGQLTLSGNDTYTGATVSSSGTLLVTGSLSGTVSVAVTGGTLQLGAANALNSAARLTLGGGVINAMNNSQTLSDLTLATSGTLDLGASSSAAVLQFANSANDIWTGALTIADWNGSATGGLDDQVYFGANSSGLTAGQLADIQFLNPDINGVQESGDYSAGILTDGEIVPTAVPEPETWAALVSGFGLLISIQRSRKRRMGA